MKLKVLAKPWPTRLNIYSSHNIYSLAHVLRDSSIERVKAYFGKEIKRDPFTYSPVCEGEVMREVAWSTTVSIKYMREFKDGLIQIAGFGHEHGCQPGTCWAFYGNIVSPDKSTRVKDLPYSEPAIKNYEYVQKNH